MKKSLFLFLLVAFCNHLFAQTAQIIINNYPQCTLHVILYTTDLGSGNPSACDIMTSDIVIPPSGLYGRLTPDDVQTIGPGFAYFTTFISSLSSVADWIWDSAEFHYDCPGSGCNAGSNVNNMGTTSGTCSLVPSATWSDPCGHSAGWMTPSSLIMYNHTIDFY